MLVSQVAPRPIAEAAAAALVAVHRLVRLESKPKLLVTEKPKMLAMSEGRAVAEVPANMAPPKDVPPIAVRAVAALVAVKTALPTVVPPRLVRVVAALVVLSKIIG